MQAQYGRLLHALVHVTPERQRTLTRMSRSKSYSKRFKCSCSTAGNSSYWSPISASCAANRRSHESHPSNADALSVQSHSVAGLDVGTAEMQGEAE